MIRVLMFWNGLWNVVHDLEYDDDNYNDDDVKDKFYIFFCTISPPKKHPTTHYYILLSLNERKRDNTLNKLFYYGF